MMAKRMTRPTYLATLSPWRRALRKLYRALWVSTVLLLPGWSAAQAPGCGDLCALYSGLVMAPERDLIGSIRTLEKVAKPAVGPRNTRGRWVQHEVYLGAEAYDTTFYLRSGLVQRIELASIAPDAQCRTRMPWANTIAALEAWQGKEAVTGQFDSGNSAQQSVYWSRGGVDVSVYLSVATEACSTKVVFKMRDVQDATEL